MDDDWDIREAMRDALAEEGYDAITAADGQSALAWLRGHPAPGLILLDWNMAPMSGPEFMRAFAEEPAFSATPVILLTADAQVSARSLGCDVAGCLKKPIDLDLLLRVVDQYCGVRLDRP